MEHKNYIDIQAFRNGFNECFNKGDLIEIQEKIDGANASFQINENGEIEAFSRKTKLDIKNDLRGFYEWTQGQNKESLIKYPNYRMFGEWLVSHSVPYPQDKYGCFYGFDIYDTENKCWLSQDIVQEIYKELGINFVPIFYKGEFVSIEHCLSFVGKTSMGGDYGEGIVVKNQTRLNDPNNRLPFYIKIVGEKFHEKTERKHKEVDLDKLNEIQRSTELAKTIITKARVQKLLHKMVDEGILVEDWAEKEMGIIAKNISSLIYYDCLKEEKGIVEQITDFGKLCCKLGMSLVKEILKEK